MFLSGKPFFKRKQKEMKRLDEANKAGGWKLQYEAAIQGGEADK